MDVLSAHVPATQSSRERPGTRHRLPYLARASWIGALLFMCSAVSVAAEGEKLFASCAACHGSKGEGNATLNAPAIAGQDAAYIERQLLNFRNRRRGTHKADVFGAQMQAAATVLPDLSLIHI